MELHHPQASHLIQTVMGSTSVEENITETIWQIYVLKHKNMRYRLHSEMLKIYKNEKIIPQGLIINVRPTVDKNESEFLAEWEDKLRNFSPQMMDSLINFYEKRVSENVQAIEDAYTKASLRI